MPRSYAQPECDVAVLGGDICTGLPGVVWAAETFTVPVIYVLGNHETYGRRILPEHLLAMKQKALGTNVMVLEDEAVVVGGVRFVCATLWTDYALQGDVPLAMERAMNGMNDYRQIHEPNARGYVGRPTTPQDMLARHEASRAFISRTLREPHDGPSVVVTHHAPSERSCNPRYVGTPLQPCFASNMEDFVVEHAPQLWLHGHVHDSADYLIGTTRVVTNPRGYVQHDLNPSFNPAMVLEV